MRCFLACLGSSKDKKGKRLQSNRVPAGARDQRRGYNPGEQVVYSDGSFKPAQPVDVPGEDVKPVAQAESPNDRKLDSPSGLACVLQNTAADEFSAESNEFKKQEASPKKSSLASPTSRKSADKSSSGAKKKVSFNSVVKTYEPVPTCELLDEISGREEFIEKTEAVAKPSKSNSFSEAGSNGLSLGSYPPNHRYQNCRESDDEEEELDYEESDTDVGDDDEGSDLEEDEYSDGDVLTDSLCSIGFTTRVSPGGRISLEVNSPEKISERSNFNLNTRGRDGYDQSVLNPVENLSQWKALKAKGKPPLQPQKENSALECKEPPVVYFSHEPNFNPAAGVKPKVGRLKHQTQQIAVDASLSNWLISSEPLNKSNAARIKALQNATPKQTVSQGSYSPKSLDDRPILGALTAEELKLMSRTSSPKKSPGKSPDDMVIIGSVGSYWSNKESDQDSAPVSSYKGIQNKTSKYKEDMRVNWDSTPFETRLEKALNQGGLKQCHV